MQHLIDRQAENVAVHGRHAVEIPILGVLLDDRISFVPVLQRPANHRLGKMPHGRFVRGRRRQLKLLAPAGGAFLFGDRRRALRIPELIQRLVQVLRRIQVVLE